MVSTSFRMYGSVANKYIYIIVQKIDNVNCTFGDDKGRCKNIHGRSKRSEVLDPHFTVYSAWIPARTWVLAFILNACTQKSIRRQSVEKRRKTFERSSSRSAPLPVKKQQKPYLKRIKKWIPENDSGGKWTSVYRRIKMVMLKIIILPTKIQFNFNVFHFFISETHLAVFIVSPFLWKVAEKTH